MLPLFAPTMTREDLDTQIRITLETDLDYTIRCYQPDMGAVLKLGLLKCMTCNRSLLSKGLPGNDHEPIALGCGHIYCGRCIIRLVDFLRNPATACFICSRNDTAYNALVSETRDAMTTGGHSKAADTSSVSRLEQEEPSNDLVHHDLSMDEGSSRNSDAKQNWVSRQIEAAEALLLMSQGSDTANAEDSSGPGEEASSNKLLSQERTEVSESEDTPPQVLSSLPEDVEAAEILLMLSNQYSTLGREIPSITLNTQDVPEQRLPIRTRIDHS